LKGDFEEKVQKMNEITEALKVSLASEGGTKKNT